MPSETAGDPLKNQTVAPCVLAAAVPEAATHPAIGDTLGAGLRDRCSGTLNDPE